ncbi:MAG: class I SAM-dependent methyltransferase [Deltaproteobacteria bacterium]|jgi:cyclopropane fatty-acyl-phospholipid synthase-like methyltransferase|nr:class I SAM-dependent methyltransferase [Deltaproteobacteria bacterium]MBW2532302.1 class I SAM-dependent methyltransferase [Deltaproteobacteria bacterium]
MDKELAGYFGIAPEISRFLPDLLQDLWELGSDPELVVRWLGDEGLGEQARVLDLGSGKGAVSLAVAEQLGCQVEAVEALPAFVEIARAEARRRGVDEQCRFEVGDLREAVARARDFDAVLLVSVGVLGSPGEMVAGCRQCVKPGGLIIVDDGYLDESQPVDFPGYGQMVSRDETLRQLTSHGDEVVSERVFARASIREQNLRYSRWIEQRAAELGARHPEHAAAFQAYVDKERRECELLETSVTCATWMLRRAG